MAGPGPTFCSPQDGGEFALDCLTGSIHGHCEGDAVEFTWNGNDEMEPASGHGWAEMQDDGSLEGEICLEGGDEFPSSPADRPLLQQPARASSASID